MQVQNPNVTSTQVGQLSTPVETQGTPKESQGKDFSSVGMPKNITARQATQTEAKPLDKSTTTVSTSSESIESAGKSKEKPLSEAGQKIFDQVDSFRQTAMQGKPQISETLTPEAKEKLETLDKLETATKELKTTLSSLGEDAGFAEIKAGKEKLTELATTLKECGLGDEAANLIQEAITDAQTRFSALMTDSNISVNQEQNLAPLKEQVHSALTGTIPNVNVLELCEKYVATEQLTNPDYSMDDLRAELSPPDSTKLQALIDRRDAMPEGMQELYSLCAQMDKYNDGPRTAFLTANADTFKAAQSGKPEDMKKAWDLLDKQFMANPAIAKTLQEVKASFIKDSNAAQTALLTQQHTARLAVGQLLNCLADKSTMPDVTAMTADKVLAMLDNPPKTKDGALLDFYTLDVYMQLAKLENPKATNEQILEKLSPENKEKAIAMQTLWKAKGITSSTQLAKADQILSNAQLNKATMRALLHSFKKALPNSNAMMAEKSLKTFAKSVLGVNTLDSFSPKGIVALCTAYLEVDTNLDVGKAIAGATAVVYDAMRGISEQKLDQDLADTFKLLLAKQQESGANKTRGQRFLGMFKANNAPSSNVLGETHAYSMLSLQKMLVTDARSLSTFDMAKIGLTSEVLNDSARFEAFAKEYFANNSGDVSFVASALATTLKANIEAGKPTPTAEEADRALKAIVKNFDDVVKANTFSTDDFKGLLSGMAISKMNVNFASGVSNNSVADDDAGALLKNLMQRAQGKNVDFGLTSFTINGTTFTTGQGPTALTPEQAKEAMQALLNSTSLSVTPKGSTEARVSEFINPIMASQSLVRNRVSSLGKDKGGFEVIENARDKVFSGLSRSAKGKDSAFAKMTTGLQAELANVASIRGRQQSTVAKVAQDLTAKLFANSDFSDKVVPLIMQAALAQTNTADKASFFALDETRQHTVLSDIVQGMGITKDASDMVAHALIAKKDDVNLISELYAGMAEISNVFTSFDVYLKTPPAARNTLAAMDIAQNTMVMLQTLSAESSLELNVDMSAGFGKGFEFGFVSVDADIRAGESKNMSLWRDESGKPSLNINVALFAKLGVDVGLAGVVNLGAEAEIEGKQGLKLSFADDESCAQFLGKLLSAQATKDDLKLTSSIGLSSGTTIGGTLKAGVELTAEDPVGICTVGATAGLQLQGELTFRTEVRGEVRSVISEGYYNFDANTEVSATLNTSKNAASLVTQGLVSHTSTTSPGIPDISVGIGLDYNKNCREITKVDTKLAGTPITGVEKTTEQQISCSDPVAASRILCQKLGVPVKDIADIEAFLSNGGPSVFNLSVSRELNTVALGLLEKATPQEANKIMSDPKNYEYTGVTISFSSEVYSAKTDVVFIELNQSAQRAETKKFPLAA